MIGCSHKSTDTLQTINPQSKANHSTQNVLMTMSEFEEFCDSCKIPSDLDLWVSSGFRDFETNKILMLYLYLNDNDGNDIFRLKVDIANEDTIYTIIHRVTK